MSLSVPPHVPLPARVLLVRHPQSVANIDRSICRSISDHAVGLSRAGDEQLTRLRAFIREYDGLGRAVNLFYSPFVRTRLLAWAIAEELSIARGERLVAQADARLAEIRYGRLKGLSDAEWAQRYPANFQAYQRQRGTPALLTFVYPGGESLQHVYERTGSFLRTLPRAGTSLIISHEVPLKMLCLHLGGFPAEHYPLMDGIANAEVLAFEPGPDASRSKHVLYPG